MVAGNLGEYLTFEIDPLDRGHNVEYMSLLMVGFHGSSRELVSL